MKNSLLALLLIFAPTIFAQTRFLGLPVKSHYILNDKGLADGMYYEIQSFDPANLVPAKTWPNLDPELLRRLSGAGIPVLLNESAAYKDDGVSAVVMRAGAKFGYPRKTWVLVVTSIMGKETFEHEKQHIEDIESDLFSLMEAEMLAIPNLKSNDIIALTEMIFEARGYARQVEVEPNGERRRKARDLYTQHHLMPGLNVVAKLSPYDAERVMGEFYELTESFGPKNLIVKEIRREAKWRELPFSKTCELEFTPLPTYKVFVEMLRGHGELQSPPAIKD